MFFLDEFTDVDVSSLARLCHYMYSIRGVIDPCSSYLGAMLSVNGTDVKDFGSFEVQRIYKLVVRDSDDIKNNAISKNTRLIDYYNATLKGHNCLDEPASGKGLLTKAKKSAKLTTISFKDIDFSVSFQRKYHFLF